MLHDARPLKLTAVFFILTLVTMSCSFPLFPQPLAVQAVPLESEPAGWVYESISTPVSTVSPARSPQIVFQNDSSGHFDLFIMPADGSAPPRNLTNHPASDVAASCSPDGQWITFISNRADEDAVYLMDITGQNVRRVVSFPSALAKASTWLDAQTVLVLEDGGPSHRKMYLVDLSANRLEEFPGEVEIFFDIIPSPQKDAWLEVELESEGDLFDYEIFLYDASGAHQLTNNVKQWDLTPVWSPDGNLILFSSEMDGDAELYIMNRKGEIQTRLTDNQDRDLVSCWIR
jgi:dipeptidyl aminopeptidase/acylaminoacyl peptidase